MRKDQREELQRLEEALLDADVPVKKTPASGSPSVTDEEFDLWLKDFLSDVNMDTYPAASPAPKPQATPAFDVYNADEMDVELEAYSEEIQEDTGRTPIGLTIFCILLIPAMLWVIWYLINVLRMM